MPFSFVTRAIDIIDTCALLYKLILGNLEALVDDTSSISQIGHFEPSSCTFSTSLLIRQRVPINTFTYQWMVPEIDRVYLLDDPEPLSTPAASVSLTHGA